MIDSSSSILKISVFDTWSRERLKYDSEPCEYRVKQGIKLIKKRTFAEAMEREEFKMEKRGNFLVVPDRSESSADVVKSSEVVRIE